MVPILLVAVMLTALVSYRLSVARLEGVVSRLSIEHRGSIASMLWQFDIEGIEERLRSFVGQDAVRWAAVSDVTGRIIEEGSRRDAADAIEIAIPLIQRHEADRIDTLGSLSIQASRDGIWHDAIRRALIMIAIVAASTMIVVALVMRQIDRNVLSPLLAVAGKLRDAPDDLGKLHIDLERGDTPDGKDEIDELVDSIHQMRDRILSVEEEVEARDKRLAQAAQMAGLSYCTFDPDMERVIECDENYALLHGRTVSEMLSPETGRDAFPGSRDGESAASAEAFRRRIRSGDRETLIRRLDFDGGEFIHIRQCFVAVRDDDGAVRAVSVIAQDATDDVLNQEILLQTQKSDAVGKLTGGVAHDFNNLLAVIMGNVEMMICNCDDPAVVAHGEAALEAVTLGAGLTGQLLSFARKQPLRPVALDAAKSVRDSALLLRTSAGESVDLQIVSEAGVWKTRADPAQLEAVLLNLVINARDAMPSGGALTIDVGNAHLDPAYAKAHMEVEAGDYVRISVSDVGEGMTPHTMKHAIEPFFTTKPVGEGTGLGLSMAFGFAKQSGGHLKIRSEAGQGTTVDLYLPRVHEVAGKDRVATSRRSV